MDQRISFLTIGVKDLDAMKHFYNTVFGWTPVKDSDGIVFYKLNGFILALYPATELAEEVNTTDDGEGFKRFSLSVNFRSEAEVDAIFGSLELKGAKVIRMPEKVFWGGYRGYIGDIEGNCWELAYNPFLDLDSSGNVKSHQ